MRPTVLALAAAATVLPASAFAAITNVADYRDDFANPAKPGWSYRWNATAPLPPAGASTFSPLTYDTTDGRYEAVGDPAATNLFVGPTSLHPGKALGQDGTLYERYALVSYTIQADDIPAGVGAPVAYLPAFSFSLPNIPPSDPNNPQDPYPYGVNARFYVNDVEISAALYGGPIPLGEQPFNEGSFGGQPFPLGPVAPGSTITFAIGASGPGSFNPTSPYIGNDQFDTVDLDFTIGIELSPIPEPTGLAAVALGAVSLMRRRRR